MPLITVPLKPPHTIFRSPVLPHQPAYNVHICCIYVSIIYLYNHINGTPVDIHLYMYIKYHPTPTLVMLCSLKLLWCFWYNTYHGSKREKVLILWVLSGLLAVTHRIPILYNTGSAVMLYIYIYMRIYIHIFCYLRFSQLTQSAHSIAHHIIYTTQHTPSYPFTIQYNVRS